MRRRWGGDNQHPQPGCDGGSSPCSHGCGPYSRGKGVHTGHASWGISSIRPGVLYRKQGSIRSGSHCHEGRDGRSSPVRCGGAGRAGRVGSYAEGAGRASLRGCSTRQTGSLHRREVRVGCSAGRTRPLHRRAVGVARGQSAGGYGRVRPLHGGGGALDGGCGGSGARAGQLRPGGVGKGRKAGEVCGRRWRKVIHGRRRQAPASL